MKHSATITHINQLCCLGLGGEAIMPSLLRDLHELVPCDSAAFFWVDSAGEMTCLYAERLLPQEVMGLYFSRFYGDGEAPFRVGFARRAQASAPVSGESFSESFYRSDYYNLIWRHLDAHRALYAVIRENGHALGQLSLYRTSKDPPFTAAEHARLAAVVRYIAHGLTTPPQAAWQGIKEDAERASGLLVFDAEGTLVHASAQGKRLLFLATYPRISPAAFPAGGGGVPSVVTELCRRLRGIFNDEAAPPPVLHLQSPWGKFVFRAYWMGEAAESALIGVTVQHREALPLALLSAMKGLPLSARQKEVTLLLARGDSHQAIARALNVSLNTAIYHVRQVYDKLDAHDRGEVLHRLLPRPD